MNNPVLLFTFNVSDFTRKVFGCYYQKNKKGRRRFLSFSFLSSWRREKDQKQRRSCYTYFSPKFDPPRETDQVIIMKGMIVVGMRLRGRVSNSLTCLSPPLCYRCNECNKGFMRHERYMTHLRWHSGEQRATTLFDWWWRWCRCCWLKAKS